MTQWLHFQTTTQRPLLQHIFHWDFLSKNPAAHAYYVTSFRRTLQLLNDESSDKEWLVRDKCSAADLSFVPFHSRIGSIVGADAPEVEREFPKVDAWFKRMGEREAVRKVLGDHAVVMERLGFATRK